MAALKQGVKRILLRKQHKAYEKQLSEKRMTYSDWIVKQEEKLQIEGIVLKKGTKYQINAFEPEINDRRKNQNEGFHSKNDLNYQYFELYDRKEGDVPSFHFLQINLTNNHDKNIRYNDIHELAEKTDVILFVLTEGKIAEIALPLIYKKLKEEENIILIYGDEDVENRGKREKPWLKPDWSYDTFLSYFYLGSLLAVRPKALEDVMTEGEKVSIYDLCHRMILKSRQESHRMPGEKAVAHISEILFHGEREAYSLLSEWKLSADTGITNTEITNTEIKGTESEYGKSKKKEGIQPEEKELISVIIPSKDNPRVLFHCIHSLLKFTKCSYPYEIILVDNGSNSENRQQIEIETEALNQKTDRFFRGIRYHYVPMAFNFSKMCNLGADLGRGALYLFLNDDMEVIQEDWLEKLADKAVLPYAGCVGAKLLYPDSDIIQHAGITNLRVGPAHKLQFLSDREVHYYGKNRFVHDCLAVTGACLLLRKEIFEKAGGFTESLAVAFNDVDLCYGIYEAGYVNMVRNDVVLYHHESLSRGKDGDSPEKQKRLLKEKDILYERHQDLYGKDPFYHKYLTSDMLESEYTPAFHYQVTLDMPWAKTLAEAPLSPKVREDACVVIGMEAAMDIYKWKYGVDAGKGQAAPEPEDMGYYFQGYTFVIGADNACYKKTLLLKNTENNRVIRIKPDERVREDIRDNLKDQLNVDLTGFAAKVKLDSIPKGTYRFGMLMEERYSRQKLVNYSSWTLEV